MRKLIILILVAAAVAILASRREKLMGQVKQAGRQAGIPDSVDRVKDQVTARTADLSDKVKDAAGEVKAAAADAKAKVASD